MPPHLCGQYLAALNDSNLDRVLTQCLLLTRSCTRRSMEPGPCASFSVACLRTRGARARSPCESSTIPRIRKLRLCNSVMPWTMANGSELEFECVDIFGLAEDKLRFHRLTIIYGAAHFRSEFAALSSDAAPVI